MILFNAVVTTKRAGLVVLSSVQTQIVAPRAEAITAAGGYIEYRALFPPGTDIKQGDELYIEAWGPNTVDAAHRSLVTWAINQGGLGLEVRNAGFSDNVQ